MKRNVQPIWLVAACAALVCSFAARAVDVAPLDVAGVRLAMTPTEATAAIAGHFHVAPAAIKQDVGRGIDIFPKPYVQMIEFDNGHERMTVSFTLSVLPMKPGRPFEAWQVTYSTPRSAENTILMHRASLAKYGKATIDQVNFTQWCDHADEVACDTDKPKLDARDANLMLIDPRYATRLQQLREELKRTKPNF